MSRAPTRQPDFLTTLSEGRSGRRQFWSFYAFVIIPGLGLWLAWVIGERGTLQAVLLGTAIVWTLLSIVPLTASMARRFHDIGWSGWWSLGQHAALVLAISIGSLYPLMARPEGETGCVRIDFSAPPRLGQLPKILPLPPEKRRACDESDRRIDAFDNRAKMVWITLAGLVASAHLWTLAVMSKPSESGPNKYGPNPQEVTP